MGGRTKPTGPTARSGFTAARRRANIAAVRIPAPAGALVLAAYAVNELASDARDRLLETLRTAQASGASLLVVEPIARRVNLWWNGWADIFIAAGGRADDWRFRVTLPPRQRTLAKAAGLEVQELTARSLYVWRPAAAFGVESPDARPAASLPTRPD